MTKSVGNASTAALVLGLVHAAVDLACAFILFRDLSHAYGAAPATVAAWVIAYDALAFAAQAPLGLVADRVRAYRWMSLVGIAAVAVALGAGPFVPRVASAVAGIGNALFHVGAGGHVLRVSGPGARAIGIFVGPGAIGLCLGILAGGGQAPYRLAVGVALVVAWAATAWAVPRAGEVAVSGVHQSRPALTASVWLCLGLLLATVTLRSTIGDNVVRDWREQSTDVVVALAAVATVGKMLGGAVADRFGWIGIGGSALVLAAPIVAFERAHWSAAIAGMLLLQTSTPLTLKAIHCLVPNRPGFAFGIPSAALLLGAAPGLFDVWLLAAWPALLAATLLSALGLVAGLRLQDRQSISAPALRAGPDAARRILV